MSSPPAPRRSRPAAAAPAGHGALAEYRPLPGSFDELVGADGQPHAVAAPVLAALAGLGHRELRSRQRLADRVFLESGITFSVYADRHGTERIFPFDLVPRITAATDWDRIERGLQQRLLALQAFLDDVYGAQRILNDGVVPRELVEGSAGYRPEVRDIRPRGGTRVHVAGIDLIRGPEGQFLVLEDNLRTPSGVSYVLENRAVMKRVIPGVFRRSPVRSVEEYPQRLRSALDAHHPVGSGATVVLSPGPFNSAYFEHAFLARRMGCDLVLASDLFVEHDRVFLKTTAGPQPVEAIYRRVDDEFLDPTVFRADTLLGVPGIFGAWAAGHCTLANAIGNGVADDKAIYPFVPDMIRYYADADPILPQVPTFVCARPDECAHVLANLDAMVVKAVDASGGYGMLMGPQASKSARTKFAAQIRANPRGYIAQPLVELSTCPTLIRGAFVPRRVDLRPYVVTGTEPWVLPGGLTRVALEPGSYVVNSSQGGGSKDTWVLDGDGA